MRAVKNLSHGPQRLWRSLLSIQARSGHNIVQFPSAAASTAANETSASGKSEQKQHPMLDYSHPSQPGTRPYEYTDPMKDYGWHLSGPFFERPHVRRYTDHFQGDGKVSLSHFSPAQGKNEVPLTFFVVFCFPFVWGGLLPLIDVLMLIMLQLHKLRNCAAFYGNCGTSARKGCGSSL